MLNQFRITLLDIKPAIWRRVQVPDCNHADLHQYIQATFGWWNYHLHQFEIDGERYSHPVPDGNDFGVYARRYSPGGVAQGDEFRVNTTTAGQQNLPSVAMDADGDFSIVWNSVGQDGSGFGVFAQRYSANSGPTANAGGPYQVLEGASLTLNAGASTDPDQGDVLTFAWDVNGDGDFGEPRSNPITKNHKPQAAPRCGRLSTQPRGAARR